MTIKRIAHLTCGVGCLMILGLGGQLSAQVVPFTVTSPVAGQTVYAGSTVQLILSPAAGLTVTGIQVWSPIGSYVQHSGTAMTLTIPNDTLGPVTLRILGETSDGSGGSVERTIQVATTQTLSEVIVSPVVVSLAALGTGSGLDRTQLTITGRYADGVLRDISHLPELQMQSDTPSVATVNSTGLITAVAPGQASISATVGLIIGSARVNVNISELRSDLDGDGDVDQDDLNILAKGLNLPITGPGDPRDLNADGVINNLDSQALSSLCSRAACATADGTPSGSAPVSVFPTAGSAGRQVFNLISRHGSGANSILYAQFLFSKSGLSALNGCYISYDPSGNVFYLLSDDLAQWYGLLGGSGNTIGNAQCTIHGQTSGSTKIGMDLSVNVDISFRAGFSGQKTVYQFSGDILGGTSGWRTMGI